ERVQVVLPRRSEPDHTLHQIEPLGHTAHTSNLARSGAGMPPPYRRVVLKPRLFQLIDANGPLPFEEFMRLALYDPDGGFFAGAELRSEKAGDFLTSPEVSPMFGETLAELVRREHARIG